MLERFLAAVGDPHLAGRDLTDGRGELVPVGMVRDDQRELDVTLAGPLASGEDVDPLLHKVRDRRMFPTRVIQRAQKLAQDKIIGRLLEPGEPIRKASLLIRLFDRFELLRRIPGRLIGLGVRRERVKSPAQPPPDLGRWSGRRVP